MRRARTILLSFLKAIPLRLWVTAGVLGSIVVVCSNESAASLLVGEETVYAPGYSAERFDQVQVGATEAKVRAALGEPLVMTSAVAGRSSWAYTRAAADGNYLCRVLTFAGGRVVDIHREFYWD